MATDRFEHSTYVIRRKVLKLFGGAFHVYGPAGDVLLYSRAKAFKLREDITVYTGEDMQTEVLTIRARQILDFAAAYDVVDSATGQKVGALKRRGWRSLVRDEWVIMDANDRDIGIVREDNLTLALVRRFLVNLVPQTYVGTVGSTEVCSLRQHFNPFVYKLSLSWLSGSEGMLDRRLGIAAGILLAAIEGRQS